MTAAALPPNLQGLFAAIDAGDARAFAGFIAANGRFRFGNAPAVEGRAAIEQAVAAFFASIRGCRHEVQHCWSDASGEAMHGTVTYARHDGREVSVPFANVFVRDGELIRDYLIFVDVAPLFAP